MGQRTWSQLALEVAKRCGRCDTAKPVTQFNPRGSKRAGYQSWCKDCFRAWAREDKRRRRGVPHDMPTPEFRSLARSRPEGSTYVHRGYILEKRTGHHRANKDGWVFQHILVAEEKYGFPITREFTVDHINDQRDDNRPENLALKVGNHGYHGEVIPTLLKHAELRAIAREVLTQYDD